MYRDLRGLQPVPGFYPNIDGYVLPKSPFQAFVDGDLADVPLLVGSNADEGSLLYSLFNSPLIQFKDRELNAEQTRALLEQEFAEDTPSLFEMYSGARDGDAGALTDILGDSMFGAPACFYAEQAAKQGRQAYLYFFDRVPPSPRQTGGAYHAAEIPFVFQTNTPILPLDKSDFALSETMVGYWAQFARTGDPNGDARPHWPALSVDTPEEMRLGPTVERRPVARKAKYDILNRRLMRMLEHTKHE